MADAPPLWTNAVAGGMAGMTVDFVLYPLDTIKTRMQTRPGSTAVSAGSAIARALNSGAFYRGEEADGRHPNALPTTARLS